tara:strand:- start:328 stop:549 length:222 start_codon:yes stop_codon:yes gene_type:complete
MSEEVNINVQLEIDEDITKQEIPTFTVDWLCNYDAGFITLKYLREMEEAYVIEELYHLAESARRAIKAVDIIF